MTRPRHVPVRSCIGCGARAPQAELLRVASTADGGLQLLTGRAHAGRSGYLHPDVACWERFAARKGPVRSLRQTVDKVRRLIFVQGLKESRRLSIED